MQFNFENNNKLMVKIRIKIRWEEEMEAGKREKPNIKL